jgi:hypothetical protein
VDEEAFVFLRVDDFDHEVDEYGAAIRKWPASPWEPRTESRYSKASPSRSGVVVREFIDDLEEAPERFRVAVGQVGVLEDVPEERGRFAFSSFA